MYLDVLSKMPLILKVFPFVLLYDLTSLVASLLATKWYIPVVDDTLCFSFDACSVLARPQSKDDHSSTSVMASA